MSDLLDGHEREKTQKPEIYQCICGQEVNPATFHNFDCCQLFKAQHLKKEASKLSNGSFVHYVLWFLLDGYIRLLSERIVKAEKEFKNNV